MVIPHVQVDTGAALLQIEPEASDGNAVTPPGESSLVRRAPRVEAVNLFSPPGR